MLFGKDYLFRGCTEGEWNISNQVRDPLRRYLQSGVNVLRLTGTPMQNIAVIEMMLEQKS
jgi:hypothetical protein